MSGLAAVLAGHEAPGIHLWHGAFAADDVRHTVEHAGWAFGHVDGWTKADYDTWSALQDAGCEDLQG